MISTTMTQPPAASSRPPKPQDFAFAGDWTGFFGAVRGKGPRETLLTGLAKFDAEAREGKGPATGAMTAVDLACGEGRDTLELLRRGWKVIAIEPMEDGLAMLREQAPPGDAERLTTLQADFGTARWPLGVDLVNCSFSLPFCPAEQFEDVWARIAASIRPGGRFCGQFFGDRDSWGRCGRTITQSRTRINELLEAFVLEELREDEKDDLDAQTPKHWHVLHVVARRR